MKIQGAGLIILVLCNESWSPIHLTPCLKVAFCLADSLMLLMEKAAPKCMVGSGCSMGSSLQELKRLYPEVFNTSPTAMKVSLTLAKLAINKQDIGWKKGFVSWTNRSHYQAISACKEKAVRTFALLQFSCKNVKKMGSINQGVFAQSPFIPKKNLTPWWVVDFGLSMPSFTHGFHH